jgi:hypothetical protein
MVFPVAIRGARMRRGTANLPWLVVLGADTGSEDTVIRRKPADQLEEHRRLHLSCVTDLVDG